MMEKREEGIGDSMRPKNKFESQGESIHGSCTTSNGVPCRELGSEESTREEGGCGGDEDVKMVIIRNDRIIETTKEGEKSKQVQESRLKW